MTGSERALLYTLASETGLRSSELPGLTAASFDLTGKPPPVTIPAASSKRRKEDTLPLRGVTAEALGDKLAEMGPGELLFKMPPRPDVARLIFRPDLAAARERWIAEASDGPERARRRMSTFLREVDNRKRRLDFHALRHTFVTRLSAAGVGFATAQRLARHSTPALLGRYGHSFGEDEVRAVEEIGPSEQRAVRAP